MKKVDFATPLVAQTKEYACDRWDKPATTVKTRQDKTIANALLNTTPCKHCICSTITKNNVECSICGIWYCAPTSKRALTYICNNCKNGNPPEQVKCNTCNEFVHADCYTSASHYFCTSCTTDPYFEKRERLHTQGCTVFRNAILFDEYTIDSIRHSRFLPIFNGLNDKQEVTYDGKRLMATGEWSYIFKKRLKTFLEQCGFLHSTNGKKSINEVYALKSIADCPEQPKHADSAPEASLRDKDPTDVPLAVLYAIEPNTKLKVWRFDQISTLIILQPGDLVIFRGDLAHAGCQYNMDNIRLHAYIDSTAPGCKREKGKTYILSNDRYVKM